MRTRAADIACVVIAAVVAFPLYWMVLSALKPAGEIQSADPRPWTLAPTVDSFRRVLDVEDFGLYFVNSLVVAVAVVVLSLGASFLAAVALTRFRFSFDAIVDSGLFHTWDDDERLRYVESLTTVLPAGGAVHLLCFSDAEPGDGGPRRVSRAELEAAFADGWRIVSLDATRYATGFGGEGARAWLAQIERCKEQEA